MIKERLGNDSVINNPIWYRFLFISHRLWRTEGLIEGAEATRRPPVLKGLAGPTIAFKVDHGEELIQMGFRTGNNDDINWVIWAKYREKLQHTRE